MVKCPECDKEVSDKAPICPNCGYEVKDHFKLINQIAELGDTEDEKPIAQTEESINNTEIEPILYDFNSLDYHNNLLQIEKLIKSNHPLREKTIAVGGLSQYGLTCQNEISYAAYEHIRSKREELTILLQMQYPENQRADILMQITEVRTKGIDKFNNDQYQSNPYFREAHDEMNESINTPKCPTCQSTNVKKISGLDRGLSVGIFGLFSKKINKSFKCNSCGYTW